MTMRWNLLILMIILLACSNESEDQTPNVATAFAEQHRPQFHFSPPQQWMNDPNGMVYHEGEYHLFYQHYPDSNIWGPMHWGHAVSTDLVHWEHLPIALYPDEHGYIFSGSAVVDHNNTTGFGSQGETPLVAIYSYHNAEAAAAGAQDFQTQGIAYSLDRGRTWTKYEDNPVLSNPGVRDFRDPKVIWHEGTQRWIMALAVQDHLRLYGSPNLKNWKFLSSFGEDLGSHAGVWECPDLFPLTAENGTEYWVLLQNMNPGNPNGGSGTQYFIGDFDGQQFTVDSEFLKFLDGGPYHQNEDPGSVWLDAGADNYAGVTWSDIPEKDGRRIFLGWMSNWSYAQKVPTDAWRSAMTIPWSLGIRHINNFPRLVGHPVRELTDLQVPGSERLVVADEALSLTEGLADLSVTVDLSLTDTFSFTLSNDLNEKVIFTYDKAVNEFSFDRSKSGNTAFSEEFAAIHTTERHTRSTILNMRILLDVSSAEIFLDDGANVFTEIYFPSKVYDKIVFTVSEPVSITGSLWRLEGIWGN